MWNKYPVGSSWVVFYYGFILPSITLCRETAHTIITKSYFRRQENEQESVTFSLTASSLSENCCCFWEIVVGESRSTSGCLHSNWEVTISITSRQTSMTGLDIANSLVFKTPVPKESASSIKSYTQS